MKEEFIKTLEKYKGKNLTQNIEDIRKELKYQTLVFKYVERTRDVYHIYIENFFIMLETDNKLNLEKYEIKEII